MCRLRQRAWGYSGEGAPEEGPMGGATGGKGSASIKDCTTISTRAGGGGCLSLEVYEADNHCQLPVNRVFITSNMGIGQTLSLHRESRSP